MNFRLPILIFLTSFLLFSSIISFSQTVISQMDLTAGTSVLNDKPIAGYQSELLDLAFETATSIPVVPHIKDRSRAQEKVVDVSLKLDQPQKALKYIEKIDDWRRGAGYGDLAFYHVINGHKDVERYISLARQIADASEDWRRDTIKVKIAKIYTLLGEDEKALAFEKNIVDSESGKVAGIKAKLAPKESFKEQFNALDILVKTENFDIIKNALESYTELYSRFYAEKKYREQVEKKIKASWEKMPIIIRIDLISRLAQSALENSDDPKALKFANEAQAMLDEHQWPLENFIPIAANISKLRYQAGDEKKALNNAKAVLSKFEAEKESIVDIYRAQALCPLAEAFSVMGDQKTSISVYKKALDESVVNPNSRPRAEDLTAVLSSLAQSGIEPDDQLWEKIRTIKNSLGSPW